MFVCTFFISSLYENFSRIPHLNVKDLCFLENVGTKTFSSSKIFMMVVKSLPNSGKVWRSEWVLEAVCFSKA